MDRYYKYLVVVEDDEVVVLANLAVDVLDVEFAFPAPRSSKLGTCHGLWY